MTFKEYLAARRITDTPAGDFTADARSDARMPEIADWRQLREYLECRAPIAHQNDVIEAARQVWGGYQAQIRRQRGNA